MSIKKTEKGKTITSRDVCRIISMCEQIPFEHVQQTFNCFYKLCEHALSQGYIICIPASLGKIRFKEIKSIKKGTEKRVGNVFVEKIKNTCTEDFELFEKSDGTYWVRYLKDTPKAYYPYIKLSRPFKNRIKEASKEWQE